MPPPGFEPGSSPRKGGMTGLNDLNVVNLTELHYRGLPLNGLSDVYKTFGTFFVIENRYAFLSYSLKLSLDLQNPYISVFLEIIFS